MTVYLPEEFTERMSRQLKQEMPAFLAAYEKQPLRGIRINGMKAGGERLFVNPPVRIPWAENAYYLDAGSPAGATVWHEAGAFYIQEPSAMIPAAVLRARPGEKILDLCAAPGGKATQIGTDLQGKGLLIANEPVPKRARILSGNIERMGIPNAAVVSADPRKLAAKWEEAFDGVLADAPCSGEGMFRKTPEACREWNAAAADGCAKRQREILEAAVRMVRPGGRLVYSTCTFNPAENEENISWLLREFTDFAPEPFELPGIDGSTGMFCAYPHRIQGEGQFVALLRRREDQPAGFRPNQSFPTADRAKRDCFRQAFPALPKPDLLFGNTLVSMPECPDFSGIPVLRLGLHLGEIRSGIPVPDHAAAMAFSVKEGNRYDLTEEEALRFLAGEALQGEAPGWNVVRFGGYPLGWIKGSGGQLKNHYPKGLRNSRLLAKKI